MDPTTQAAEHGGFFDNLAPSQLGLIVASFLVINGVFVAMEFALVALRQTKVDEMVREKVKGAKSLQRAKRKVDDFVAASQLGITIASLLLGAAGEALFRVPLKSAGLENPVALVLLSLALMTALHVVIGEQVPKMLAIHDPTRTALWTIPGVEILIRPLAPVIWMLSKLTSLILKLFGIQSRGGHGDGSQVYSEEEIQALLGLRESAGLAEQAESEMIARVFSFFDMVATQVMIPRTEMCCIENTATLADMVELAAEQHHERYPVYGKDLDDIRGVVLLKDVMAAMHKNPKLTRPVSTLMREVLCLPGSLSISNLMSQMQKNRTRIAILLDEFGGTAGMVTYGDILERIVGEEVGESGGGSQEQDDIEKLADNDFRVSGLVLIEDFEHYFSIEIDDEHNDTIGGTVFSQIGRKPKVGDQIALSGLNIKVESLDGLRIDRLRVEKPAETLEAEAEAEKANAEEQD